MREGELQNHSAVYETALSTIWSDLCSGKARIVTSSATQRRYVLRVARSTGFRRIPNGESIALLRRVLLGSSQKAVALEFGCAPSTMAGRLRECMASMGLGCRLSRVPAILVQLLHELERPEPQRRTSVELHHEPDGSVRLESERAELGLARTLSDAEINVVALIAEGRTYAEVARERGASVRTVANQLSSVYRKLGISGRLELLCFLAAEADLSQRHEAA
jgi:DNA-binding CsgD family transcriptional regulator